MKKLSLFCTCWLIAAVLTAQTGKLLTETVTSKVLAQNKIGLNTTRKIKVYLPPGYTNSDKKYPVVYYLHSIFSDNENIFQKANIINLIERGFREGVTPEFILVAPDYSTANAGSIFENSPISGKWLDYTTEEIVPYIDSHFRTKTAPESRAVIGDFMGGRGAIKLGMVRPDIFGIVYAMHPVATGIGPLPWTEVSIDWNKILNAKSIEELKGDARAQIFLTVCQAYLPNSARPPFYCDFFFEIRSGKPVPIPENIIKAKMGFHLEESLSAEAPNLRKLRAFAFDWGRFDQVQDHVYANREFSKRLEDLGVPNEAEEYAGNPFNKNWTEDGRFYSRVLPFIKRYLTF